MTIYSSSDFGFASPAICPACKCRDCQCIDRGIWYGINSGSMYAASTLPDGRIRVARLHPNTLEEVHVGGHVTPAMFAQNYVRQADLVSKRVDQDTEDLRDKCRANLSEGW